MQVISFLGNGLTSEDLKMVCIIQHKIDYTREITPCCCAHLLFSCNSSYEDPEMPSAYSASIVNWRDLRQLSKVPHSIEKNTCATYM